MGKKKSGNKKTECEADVSIQQKQTSNQCEITEEKAKTPKNTEQSLNIRQVPRHDVSPSSFRAYWKDSRKPLETSETAPLTQNATLCVSEANSKPSNVGKSNNFSSSRLNNDNRDYRPRRSEPARYNNNSFDRDSRYRSSSSRSFEDNKTLEESDFFQFERSLRQNRNPDFTIVKETEADLFTMPSDFSLAHCVAEDMNMGSGIAVEFRCKFKEVSKLLKQNVKTGGVAILNIEDRFIYYLVTKMFSTGKPTYQSLFASLNSMKRHMVENNVKKLAMPRIGCGLDRLDWNEVKFMIEYVFKNVDIQIEICNFKANAESTPQKHKNCKLTNETYPIENIEDGTIIILLSSEDGFVSNDMKQLNKKFGFSQAFERFKKVLGDVLFYPTKNSENLLSICIVKRNREDLIDFEAFQRCLGKIQKENKKYRFYYIAMQAFRDVNDQAIMFKIINILRNTMAELEVYICWPGDLQEDLIAKESRNNNNKEISRRRTQSPKGWRAEKSGVRNNTKENEIAKKQTINIKYEERNKNVEATSSNELKASVLNRTFAETITDNSWNNLIEERKKIPLNPPLILGDTPQIKSSSAYEKYLSEKETLQPTKIEYNKPFENKYSRVCFIQENMFFQSGIPRGSDVTNFIGSLLDRKLNEGNCVFDKDEEDFFFCLVISDVITEKSLENVFTSIQKLRDFVEKYQIKQLVMGKINNKNFEWPEIELMFEFWFRNVNVELIVDEHSKKHQISHPKIKHETFSIKTMKQKSILLYLAAPTDKEFIESAIKDLKSKFSSFDPQMNKPNKIGGILKQRPHDNYVVYWCFIKKTSIGFKALQKSFQDIAKENADEHFNNIYLQAGPNDDDDVNDKIKILLSTCFPKYTIFLEF